MFDCIRLLCFPDVNWLNRFETQYCKYTEKGRVREYMRSTDLQSVQYSIFKIKIYFYQREKYSKIAAIVATFKIKLGYNGWCIFGPTPIRPTAHPTF